MSPAAHSSAARRCWITTTLFFAVTLTFLLTFADRDGYEGDDLNSILPMLHLDAVKTGWLAAYRYAWQPLSYEVGAVVYRFFRTPEAIFLLSPIAAAIALGLLFVLLWKDAAGRLAPTLIALLAVPELWYTGLYYNSTTLGLPFEAAAILLLWRRSDLVSAGLAGLCIGTATLMRIDFVLICPLLAMMAWWRQRRLSRVVVLTVAVIAALAIGFVAGLLNPADLLAVQTASTAEIAARAREPGWDARMKLSVLSIAISPVGWFLLIAGCPLLLIDRLRRHGWAALLWPLAALPTIYPLLNILSPKYALPLTAMLPLMFMGAQAAIADYFGRPALARTALLLLAVLPIFVSVSFFGHRPFLLPGLYPAREVGSHDGNRAYGGYLWQMMATDGPAARMADQTDADALQQRFLAGENMIIFGKEDFFRHGAIGWRHLQLALERQGLHGQVIAPHTLRFVANGHQLLLMDTIPTSIPPSTNLIDLRDPPSGEDVGASQHE